MEDEEKVIDIDPKNIGYGAIAASVVWVVILIVTVILIRGGDSSLQKDYDTCKTDKATLKSSKTQLTSQLQQRDSEVETLKANQNIQINRTKISDIYNSTSNSTYALQQCKTSDYVLKLIRQLEHYENVTAEYMEDEGTNWQRRYNNCDDDRDDLEDDLDQSEKELEDCEDEIDELQDDLNECEDDLDDCLN